MNRAKTSVALLSLLTAIGTVAFRMTSTPASPSPVPASLAAPVAPATRVAPVARVAPVSTESILEVHNASLTAYLPDTLGSWKQDALPIAGQRGVGLDGSRRSGMALRAAFNGNPFGAPWASKSSVAGVNLASGSPDIWEVDMALPSQGIPLVVGRSYNCVQTDESGHHDSSGFQGKNWFQISLPEIVLFDNDDDDQTEEVEDVLYLVYGADRFIEFGRVADDSDTFKSTNGAAGVFLRADGSGSEPDTWTYTDQNGNEFVFFGFDTDSNPAEGQFWKAIDPDDNTLFVGDSSTASTAISNDFDASGRATKIYDATDRRYTYTYTSDLLTEVKAETKTGGTWASPTGLSEVGKVEYSYYGVSESNGSQDDLELVEITTPLTDSGVSVTKEKHYRYWKGTFDADTNPGHDHHIKYVVGFEGCRNYDWSGDSTFDEDFLADSDSSIEPYAEAYFEYDSSNRVDLTWGNGACNCSGAADGAHEFEYESNGSYSDGSGYDQTWMARTVVKRPDASYLTQHFDEVHQPLTRVITDADPDNTDPVPDRWVTKVTRDTSGIVTDISTPANVTGYTHSTGAVTTSTSAGLVRTYTLIASGAATEGFLSDRKFKEGTSGSAYLDGTLTYSVASHTVGSKDVNRPTIASQREYTQEITSGTTGSNEWSYTTTFHSETGRLQLAVMQVLTTMPAVTTANNGSNSSNSSKQYFNKDGSLGFESSPLAYITYHEYTDGQKTKVIQDADTDTPHADFSGITIPSGFSSTDTEIHWVTSTSYDAQGRVDETTPPGSQVGKHYYSKLADARLVTLTYNDYDSGTPKFYGPVQYSVTNHARQSEVRGVVALTSNESTTALTGHIDETDSDPITAVDLGTVAALTTGIYDEPGTEQQESRLYFTIPASGAGSDGTNYDPTFFAYNDSGRQIRQEAAHGTINRTAYNLHGKATERKIGTNDNGEEGGDTSGTNDMVKTEAMEYDSGNDDGNGLLTKRTLYVENSDTDKRETSYAHDVRGNVLLETNPLSPHAFHKYDNLDRRLATGLFSSTASITVSSDDPTTETTNRLGLSQTFFDEMDRNWKSQVHKIDDSDGSDDDNLQDLRWFDAEGQLVKRDGSQLEKYAYDRLGRQTHFFALANDASETAYADADDVTGDIVLEERQTTYDTSDGKVIMSAVIERFHDDKGAGETTGALDTNADSDALKYTAANLEGRIQITAQWHGIQGVTDDVSFGTYGDADFNRNGMSAPTRSDDALRASYTYTTDGFVEEVTDPMGIVARSEYDDAGNVTKEIRNYDASVNSGNSSGTDDNQTVKYEYTDGLMTKMTVDVPSGGTDQDTLYTYGTTKGATAGDSNIGTGHLLQKAQYPDSTGGTDVVTYAYNAQSREIWRKDQSGNVVETGYTDSGATEHVRVTTVDADFDGAVKRISTTYTSLGQVDEVTQYDNATVGSGSAVSGVQYSYSDWGLASDFRQDKDSDVDATLTDDYVVSYTFEKATSGRNTIRTTGVTLPSGNALTYEYLSSSGRHDSEASRLTKIKDGATSLVFYQHNGVASVVSRKHDPADIWWKMFSGTSGDYPDLDRFNRVTSSRWTKDLATDVDFFDLDVSYDRNSNITLIEDNVHTGFDVDYTMDDLDRLTGAQQGSWNGSAIGSQTENQQWTLDHLGNWDVGKYNLNGDADWSDAGEYNDDRTHNAVNELTGRDTDDNGTDDFTLTYDEVGNLTDDGENYTYEYDVFGRLRKVKNRSTAALVSEYKYNGLGHLISFHQDTDADGDVDGDDKWYHHAYDEGWRLLATYREDDTDPKEEFVLHDAGLDGGGGSSHINSIISRYKDKNTAWTSASDGVLENVNYYCQNWRGDVSVLIDNAGAMLEWDRYSSYGIPFGLTAGDTDSNGATDSTDTTNIQTHIDNTTYHVTADLDLDGDVDTTDKVTAASFSNPLGRAVLSDVGNHAAYAGYQLDAALAGTVGHVRNRVLSSSLGRWTRRDPLEYVDGPNVYAYVGSRPVALHDPWGEEECECLSKIDRERGKDYSQRCAGGNYLDIDFEHPGKCAKGPQCKESEPCEWYWEAGAKPRLTLSPCNFQVVVCGIPAPDQPLRGIFGDYLTWGWVELPCAKDCVISFSVNGDLIAAVTIECLDCVVIEDPPPR